MRVRPESNIGFSSEREGWDYGIGLGKELTWGTTLDAGSRVTRTQPESADDVQRTSVLVGFRQPLFR